MPFNGTEKAEPAQDEERKGTLTDHVCTHQKEVITGDTPV